MQRKQEGFFAEQSSEQKALRLRNSLGWLSWASQAPRGQKEVTRRAHAPVFSGSATKSSELQTLSKRIGPTLKALAATLSLSYFCLYFGCSHCQTYTLRTQNPDNNKFRSSCVVRGSFGNGTRGTRNLLLAVFSVCCLSVEQASCLFREKTNSQDARSTKNHKPDTHLFRVPSVPTTITSPRSPTDCPQRYHDDSA